MYDLVPVVSDSGANQYLKLLGTGTYFKNIVVQMECVGIKHYCNTKVSNNK